MKNAIAEVFDRQKADGITTGTLPDPWDSDDEETKHPDIIDPFLSPKSNPQHAPESIRVIPQKATKSSAYFSTTSNQCRQLIG